MGRRKSTGKSFSSKILEYGRSCSSRNLYIFLFLGITVSFVLIYALWITFTPQIILKNKLEEYTSNTMSRIPPSLDIKGLNYSSFYKDQKVMTIKADSIVIDKKKLGFLRCGLFNVAKLDNVAVDIYGSIIDSETPHPSITPQRVIKKDQTVHNIYFPNTHFTDDFKSISQKRLADIEMGQVVMRIHINNDVISTISSKNAKVDFFNYCLIFTDSVEVRSGPNILETKNLSFNPANATFTTNCSYKLHTPQKVLKGNNLEIDLDLDNMSSLKNKKTVLIQHNGGKNA